ncbi:uncharacterized protein LOC129910921 [Episyrphus balteatus]|uniref:uncharacterized protein LOC129910921 n=1 Tax=Episyrphus balteatus TaxID=286459 RepID=UPI002485FB70|nr:uncharacterized protein LOC129910921 [Episyrphus balteatus]
MLVLRLMVVGIILQIFLVEAKSLLADTIKYAVSNTFNKTANLVQVVIETDSENNLVAYLEIMDKILAYDYWLFRWQIDVNNKNIQFVSDYNLLFIDSYEAFRRLLQSIGNYNIDSQVFYFIVLRTPENYVDDIQKIFSDFLFLMIANVNVIIETVFEEVLFYSFNPYQKLACQSTNPLLTHRFSANKSIKSSIPFFPPKADNLHGCPLRIGTANELVVALANNKVPENRSSPDISFLELTILKEFVSRTNFTVANIDPYFFEPEEILKSGKIDMIISCFANGPKRNKVLSKTQFYFLSRIVIVLSKRFNAFRTYVWIQEPFNSTTWICVVASLTFITGCCLILARIRRVFQKNPYYNEGLEILSVSIGAPIS